MQVKVPHKFTQAQAIEHLKRALNEGRAKAGDQATIHQEEWSDNILTFDVTAQGQRISGTVTVGEHDYDIYAKLPFMLRMFEGKIEKAIKDQVAGMLG